VKATGRVATAGGLDTLAIPVAKGTLARFFVASLLGLIACVFMLAGAGSKERPVIRAVLRGIGAIGVPFCGLSALYAGRRLFDPTPGLVLDAEGIIDRSNLIGAGRVRWDEIREIRVTQSVRQKFLTVIVSDPEKFIQRGNPMRRKAAAANHRMAESPVNITARTLKIPFDQLVAKTSEYYQRYGTRR